MYLVEISAFFLFHFKFLKTFFYLLFFYHEWNLTFAITVKRQRFLLRIKFIVQVQELSGVSDKKTQPHRRIDIFMADGKHIMAEERVNLVGVLHTVRIQVDE